MMSLQQWKDHYGNPQGSRLGLVNAAQSIGSVAALPLVGMLSDRLGRKPILLMGILLICVAVTLQAASVNYTMFSIARVVGFGGKFLVQPSPMLAEMAYPTHRGKYTCAFWTLYYLTLVLHTVGIEDSFDQTLINGLLQIFNFAAALWAAFLVGRLGRRTLFLWSGLGMLVSYVIWTACSAVNADTGSKATGIVVVVCLFTYYFHYDIAWTPLLFGYPTEIFPYSLRSKGIAVELFSIYGSLIVAAFVNPIGLEHLGWKYYTIFCALLVLLPLFHLSRDQRI